MIPGIAPVLGTNPSGGGSSLIDRTAGTNIGNMTDGGGLAASFDGNTSQTFNDGSRRVGTSGYVGKTFAAPTAIDYVNVFGSSDHGFIGFANVPTTITLYGKNGSAPAHGTDGTSLGSISFTDTTNESAGRTINSSDTATEYDHAWVTLSIGSNQYIGITELQFYGRQ